MKKLLRYFSPLEWSLWICSVLIILLAFLWSRDFYPLTLLASLVGVTALIFLAKGNVVGQFLTIVFSVLYALVSVKFRYWGEMITYLFMSLPAAAIACVSWLKNPSAKGKQEVQVAKMTARKWLLCVLSALLATLIFYFILRYFHTANLLLSTASITTSFLACALLILRSRAYALAYAANDVVLIGLWVLASISSLAYLPMVVCFTAFLCNDLYAFFNWKRIQTRQNTQEK